MGLHEKAIASILSMSNKDRYEYTIKSIADSRVLYVLADQGDCYQWYGDDDDNYFLPVWPDYEFAEMMLDSGNDEKVMEVELEDFLLEEIPQLISENVDITIFPTIENMDSVATMTCLQFASTINYALDVNYGDALDLPYLEPEDE